MPRRSRQSDERGEALVAVLNDPATLAILQEEGWYRVPVATAAPPCALLIALAMIPLLAAIASFMSSTMTTRWW